MIANLRTIRKQRGMTQGQLAEAARINRVTIAKYEKGQVEPTLDSAKRMADALGTTVDSLIGGEIDDKTADD